MDDEQIKAAKKSLVEINKAITALDPSIRAAAFEILAPLYFDELESTGGESGKTKATRKREPKATTSDPSEFYNSHDHDKAKDNVHLVAAWLYSQYGIYPLSQADIREHGNDAGLTIPTRPDNTMRTAKKDGKNLYTQKNSGWQLTVKGEGYLKETYKVKKGNKARPVSESE